MRAMLKSYIGPIAVGLAVSSCGLGGDDRAPNDLHLPEHVQTWANSASAVGIWAHLHTPISFADGRSSFEDPACPVTSDDGQTVTIRGRCTDHSGMHWVGRVTIVRSGEGDKQLTFDDYGSSSSSNQRAVLTGTADLRRIAPSLHQFDVDLIHEGGITTTMVYSGQVEGGYDSATTWNGSGVVQREGSFFPVGVVQATTEDQLLDNAICAGQAISGRTTLVSRGVTAQVHYDGASDCDEQQAARWSVDGRDQGLIEGICCSTGVWGATAGGGRPGLLGLVLGLMLFRLRRRAPRTRR